MTEAEWLTWTEPKPMLEFLQGKTSERKVRLFAVACCRRIWHLLTDERSRIAVEVAEQFADGYPTPRQPRLVYEAASDAADRFSTSTPWFGAARAAADAVRTYPPTFEHIMVNGVQSAAVAAAWAVPSETPVQAALIRDIFGNPFRSITLNPIWLTWHDGLLVSMSRQLYDSRDFSDMPILADALEEAGCSDQDILGHCRSGDEHVRGCWVVDLVLSKE
jgi:hypothetical protein